MTSGQQSMTRWVSNCAFPPKNSVQGYTRRRIQEAPNYPLAPLPLFYMALSSFQISVKMMLWSVDFGYYSTDLGQTWKEIKLQGWYPAVRYNTSCF